MKVNVNKSKIVHYRIKGHTETDVVFRLAGNVVEKVSFYKYLGLILDYSLDFNTTAKVLGDSGGRALGSMINKFICNKGLGYKTFTKLYDMTVCPILDYCAGVWGYNNFACINAVQNRGIRFYLGVHKFAPNLGINGDMGWVTRDICRKIDMIKFWNRLICTDNNRLLKKVFSWDKRLCKKNWSSEIKAICNSIDLITNYNECLYINPNLVKDRLCSLFYNQWKSEVLVTPKLRFYDIFKTNYEPENYVVNINNRGKRSVIAQLRLGILPLSIETGRYQDIPIEYRFCNYCNQNCVESEIHFLLFCDNYNELRCNLLDTVRNTCYLFDFLELEEKIKVLMSNSIIKHTATFVYNAYMKRKLSTYN